MASKLDSGFALSPVQQRIWQLIQRDGVENYFVSVDFELRNVDALTLCRAVNVVFGRYEILRMAFGMLPGMQLPVQAARSEAYEIDLVAPQVSAIQMDFSPSLQKLSSDRYRLGLSALCADAQTALQILREVQVLLEDPEFSSGAGKQITHDEDLPFTSLAQWQHDMLSEQQGVALPMWSPSNSLQIDGAELHWPFLRRQSTASTFIMRRALHLPEETARRLFALARQEHVAVEQVLYLAWSVLLMRLDSDAPAPAYLTSGRAYEEMANAMGPLARFVPLALRISLDDRFSSLLSTLQNTVTEITELQDYLPPLSADRMPGAGFAWHAASNESPELCEKGILAEAPFMWNDAALLVLSAYSAAEDQMQLFFDFNMAACDSERMGVLEEELLSLLASVLQNPQEQIGKLSIVGPNERVRLMQQFAGATIDPPLIWRAPVQDVMARLVAHPERVVLQTADQQWNGFQLSERIQQLAGQVQKAKLDRQQKTAENGAGSPVVAILLDRSIDMMASLLAVQLAGYAYLPLDASYPEERIAFMLQDSGADVLLSKQLLISGLREQSEFASLFSNISVVLVDKATTDKDSLAAKSSVLPELRSEDLAYLIYTSGSTGIPKAVAVSHGALANHMRWMLRELPLHCEDAVLQKTAISFDASVWELFAPLMAGARLVLAAPGVERDPEQLLLTLIEFRITVLQLVPSMLRMLVVNPQLPECVHLRRLCCGGEVLDAELAQQTLHALPSGAECVNLYGPTETTIQVVFERVSLDDEVVAIGRPIDNTRVYVLDEFLQPQPIGVRGEIYIAGANLAQGYFGRSELTAERFVDDPFSVTPARMYRTGDLGAWRADGRLDCFGRVDRQVKLRGYRIELGEVESMVAQQPGILMAAVVVDRDSANIDQLLCFYTLKPGASLTVAELKQQLAAALPDYMLPNWLIAIDHFPLMPNGKIDNKALLQLRPSGSQLSQAPRDTLEMRLERIWESVLHVSHVGIASNFFELGGHSLLAVRLMAEIEKEFGFRLPLTSLFSAPTIAAQAELLRGESLQMDTVLIPIRSGNPHYSPIVLVHPTGGSVLCYRDLAGGLATERPVIALQDPGLMGESNYTSVEDLATQYLDKIQPLVKDHRYLLAGWSSGGIIAYEMARQALARGYEVAFLCLIDSQVVPPDDAAPSRDRLLRSISRLIAHKAEIACPDLSGLEFDQALQKLLELAREADFVPPHADQKEIEKLFNVFEKNVTVIGRYAAGALPRRTVLMRAMHALPDAIREAAVHYTAEEKDLGWEKLCFVKVRDIAGDHMSMMETPRVAAVVEALDQELKEVERLHNLQRQILLPMLGL